MFDEKNLISLAYFKFLSVHPQYISSTIFFAKFSHNFFAKFFIIFIAKFSPHFFAKFREIFAFSISQKFHIFRETDWSEISPKNEHFRIFLERTKCENKAKWSRKIFFAKNAKFLRNDFSFSLETLVQSV